MLDLGIAPGLGNRRGCGRAPKEIDMFRPLFGLLMLLLWVPGLRADEPLELPKGLPPSFVLARMGKDGNILIRQQVMEFVPVLEEAVVEENGQKKKVAVTTYRQVARVIESKLEGKSTQFFGTDGKEVDAKEAAKTLEKETAVLLSADGSKVDPFYLRFIKDGTLILAAPRKTTAPVPVPPVQPKKE
jgi:hypothetical protein